MAFVKITGTGSDTQIMIDGIPVKGVRMFTVSAPGRDELTEITLVVAAPTLEIEGEMIVNTIEEH